MNTCAIAYCKKAVVVNFEKVWVSWELDKKGNYTGKYKIEDCREGEDNLHFCAKHAEKWRRGEL